MKYVIIIILLLPVVAQAEYLGNSDTTIAGTWNVVATDDTIWGKEVTPSSDGTFDTIFMYSVTNNARNWKAAVYQSGWNDIAAKSISSSSGTRAVNYFVFPTPLNVSASTTYTVCVWAASGNSIDCDLAAKTGLGNGNMKKDPEVYGAWPDPPSFANQIFTDGFIWVNFNEAAAGGVVNARHSPEGVGVRHSPDGQTVRHKP